MGPLAYLTGITVNLVSPFPPDEVKQQLRSASGSKFNPVSMGVKAKVFGNRVKLRWKVPLVNDWLSPVLVGKLEDDMGRTRLRAKYVASLRARIFLVVCFLFCSLLLLGLLFDWVSGEQRTGAEITFNLIAAGVFAAPVVVQALSNLGARRNLNDMFAFLERAANFAPDQASCFPSSPRT